MDEIVKANLVPKFHKNTKLLKVFLIVKEFQPTSALEIAYKGRIAKRYVYDLLETLESFDVVAGINILDAFKGNDSTSKEIVKKWSIIRKKLPLRTAQRYSQTAKFWKTTETGDQLIPLIKEILGDKS